MSFARIDLVKGDWQRDIGVLTGYVNTALYQAATDAATMMQTQSRANISGAGKFNGEWIDGLTARVDKSAGHFVILVEHSLGAMVRPHQYGAQIFGRQLLWIPFEFAYEAKNIYARFFPHKLVWVNRKKGPPPILVSTVDGQPKYFGKERVFVPKRWNVVEICTEIGKGINDMITAKLEAMFEPGA